MLSDLTGEDYVMVIGAISPLVLAFFQFLMWWRLNAVSQNVKTIETQTNSLTEKLVRETDKSSHSRGMADERIRADEAAKDQKVMDLLGTPRDTDIATDIENLHDDEAEL